MEKKYLNIDGLTEYDALIKGYVKSKVFIGTYAEYETANNNGAIPDDALVIITDDEPTNDGTILTSDNIYYPAGDETISDSLDFLNANAHNHSNKSVLDGITATKVANWDNLVSGIDSSTVDYRTQQITVQAALDYLYSQVGNSSGSNSTWSSWIEVPMYYENSKWSSVDVLPQLWSADPLEVEIYFQIINPDNSNWTLSQVIKIPTLVYEENVSGLYINLGEICANTNNSVHLNPSGVMGNVKAYIENGHIKAVDDSGGWCGDYCSLKCFYRVKSV